MNKLLVSVKQKNKRVFAKIQDWIDGPAITNIVETYTVTVFGLKNNQINTHSLTIKRIIDSGNPKGSYSLAYDGSFDMRLGHIEIMQAVKNITGSFVPASLDASFVRKLRKAFSK